MRGNGAYLSEHGTSGTQSRPVGGDAAELFTGSQPPLKQQQTMDFVDFDHLLLKLYQDQSLLWL